jgi:hypothetical protein
VGREVLQEAAEAVGATEEAFRGKFETTPGFWSRLTKARETYILAVQTALAEWCTRGDLVYHGLSGQHLLKGLPGVFKVRLVAPMEMRTRALLESHPQMTEVRLVAPMEMRTRALLESHPQMTVAQAEGFIREVDQDRARWVKVMYDADVTDSSLYDMTLNLKTHTIESACAAIGTAVAQPRFQITDEVESELFAFAAECRERLNQAKGV